MGMERKHRIRGECSPILTWLESATTTQQFPQYDALVKLPASAQRKTQDTSRRRFIWPLLLLMNVGAFTALGADSTNGLAEALDTTNLVWTTGGGNWTAQTSLTHDGVDAALSGPSGSWIETSVAGPATLTFWWLHQGASFMPESILFSMDQLSASNLVHSKQGWTQATVLVPEATMKLRWTLTNTIALSQAYGLVDEVRIEAASGPVAVFSHPTNLALMTGTNGSFAALAWGTPPLAYQWWRDGTALTDNDRTVGARAAKLTISNMEPADVGAYWLVVSNVSGLATSAVANLSLYPATITKQPSNQKVSKQSNAVFSVTASALLPLSYQWWKDGQALTNNAQINGATATTLTISNAQSLDAGEYRVVASHQHGAVTSDVAYLILFPFDLTLAGSYQPGSGSTVLGVQVVAGRAHVVGARIGVEVLDVSDPAQVVRMGGITYPYLDIIGGLTSVLVRGPVCYAWIYKAGTPLYVLDVHNPGNIVETGNLYNMHYGPGSEGLVLDMAGPYAYITPDFGNSRLFDLSDPAAPTLISTFNQGYSGRAVKVKGSRAYVAGSSRLTVFDISNPANPIQLGILSGIAGPWFGCLVLNQTHAFVGILGGGIQMLDIRDPSLGLHGSPVATRSLPEALCLVGNYLFVAEDTAGIEVFDVSDPTNILKAAEFDTAGVATGIHVIGSHAYVADGTNGLVILSLDARTNAPPEFLSQPESQSVLAGQHTQLEIAVLGSAPLAYQWWFNGTNALPGATNDSLSLGDLLPEQAGEYMVVVSNAFGAVTSAVATLAVPTPQISLLQHPQSQTLYRGTNVTLGTAAARIPPVNDPPVIYQRFKDGTNLSDGLRMSGTTSSNLNLINAAPDDSGSYRLVVTNRYGSAATSAVARLQVVAPATLESLGRCVPPGTAYGIRVSGHYAYVAAWTSGLQTLDVSNPTNLVCVGGHSTPGASYELDVHGSTVYVADTTGGLRVFDVSNPTNIILLGVYSQSNAQGVCVVGNHAFVANENTGLDVLNVSDPMKIVRVGGYVPASQSIRVRVAGFFAYVLGRGILEVLDVRDLTNVVRVGGYTLQGSPYDVQVAGAFAYVANSARGLQVLDVSQPTNIVLLSEFSLGTDARGVCVRWPLVFLAARTNGLYVLDASDPANLRVLGHYMTNMQVRAVDVQSSYAYLALYQDGVAAIRVDFPALAPPLIDSVSLPPNEVLFSFPGAAGTPYNLEYKQRLEDPSWTVLERRLGTGPRLWITNDPASGSSGFYRLRLE